MKRAFLLIANLVALSVGIGCGGSNGSDESAATSPVASCDYKGTNYTSFNPCSDGSCCPSGDTCTANNGCGLSYPLECGTSGICCPAGAAYECGGNCYPTVPTVADCGTGVNYYNCQQITGDVCAGPAELSPTPGRLVSQ
jgi:hypothetical protein